MNEIVMYRGDDKTASLTVKRNATSNFNLNGCTVTMYVKKDRADADANAIITLVGTITGAVDGLVEFYIEPSNTDDATELQDNVTYPVDFQLVTSANKKYTVLRTSFTILPK
jgi:hypothetical protein